MQGSAVTNMLVIVGGRSLCFSLLLLFGVVTRDSEPECSLWWLSVLLLHSLTRRRQTRSWKRNGPPVSHCFRLAQTPSDTWRRASTANLVRDSNKSSRERLRNSLRCTSCQERHVVSRTTLDLLERSDSSSFSVFPEDKQALAARGGEGGAAAVATRSVLLFVVVVDDDDDEGLECGRGGSGVLLQLLMTCLKSGAPSRSACDVLDTARRLSTITHLPDVWSVWMNRAGGSCVSNARTIDSASFFLVSTEQVR